MQIGVGSSREKNPILAAKEALKSASANIPLGQADLAIVFASVELSSANLLKTLQAGLGEVPILGCSGAAVISNQGVLKTGLALMLLDFPDNLYFNVACVREVKEKGALSAGKDLGEQLAFGFRNVRRDLGLVFSSGLLEEGSDILLGLQERLGRSFPIIGASAADNLRFSKTFLYYNGEVLNEGIVGILLGGKINFGLGIKHGWKPLGKPHAVTRATGNIIFEIDGRPAAELYQEYLGRNLGQLRDELRHISVLYPLGIDVPQEEEYVLRNIIAIGDDGSLKLQGNISQESSVRLMIGTKDSCLNATSQAINEAKKALFNPKLEINQNGAGNFLFVFDSASRYMLLKREAARELETIKESFAPQTPIIGLYTYGEMAPLKAISYQGQSCFHNQTVTILNIGG